DLEAVPPSVEGHHVADVDQSDMVPVELREALDAVPGPSDPHGWRKGPAGAIVVRRVGRVIDASVVEDSASHGPVRQLPTPGLAALHSTEVWMVESADAVVRVRVLVVIPVHPQRETLGRVRVVVDARAPVV